MTYDAESAFHEEKGVTVRHESGGTTEIRLRSNPTRIELRCFGQVGPEIAREHADGMRRLAGWTLETPRIFIWDHHILVDRMDAESVTQVADDVRAANQSAPPTLKVAHVVLDPHTSGLATFWSMIVNEKVSYPIRLFSTEIAALDWLAQDR